MNRAASSPEPSQDIYAKGTIPYSGQPLTFTPDGYLSREAQRFIPIGVNYWPASCGTEMWNTWPEAEMQDDLREIAALGLNSLRFFLRWDAFEPVDGVWNEEAFRHLDDFLHWCRHAGLYAQPTLFVGWMSGALFWPEWKAGRNLFSDVELRIKAARFARKVAEICRPHHGALMGFDLGNELCCLEESKAANPHDLREWCRTMTNAIHETFPESWSMAGHEQNQITSDCGWRLDDQPGTSCLSMHAYPVPHWHPVPVDGLTDPLTQSLLPFYVKVARMFNPVMVQEFGTILTRSPERQQAYLRAILHRCWEAGANGFLWWCWSDFSCSHHPYNKSAFEKELGLVDLKSAVKPGLESFLEFARELPNLPIPSPDSRAVGLYWPNQYYARNNQENPGNSPESCAPRLILAHYLLEKGGLPVIPISSDKLETSCVRTLVIASTLLTLEEVIALTRWVEAGGHLLWHGADPYNMGEEFRRLIGFGAIDFRLPAPVALSLANQSWRFNRFPRGTRVDIELANGTFLQSEGTTPIAISHRLGKGHVITILADVEGCILDEAGDPEKRDRWSDWYQGMLASLLKNTSSTTVMAS